MVGRCGLEDCDCDHTIDRLKSFIRTTIVVLAAAGDVVHMTYCTDQQNCWKECEEARILIEKAKRIAGPGGDHQPFRLHGDDAVPPDEVMEAAANQGHRW